MSLNVYMVKKEGFEPTRLHLIDNAWGNRVRFLLGNVGYDVSRLTEQSYYPDQRDAAELARRDELLDEIGV